MQRSVCLSGGQNDREQEQLALDALAFVGSINLLWLGFGAALMRGWFLRVDAGCAHPGISTKLGVWGTRGHRSCASTLVLVAVVLVVKGAQIPHPPSNESHRSAGFR